MKCVKIHREGMGGYVQSLADIGSALDGEFDGADPGDMVALEYVEMTQEEYDALPEFTGW